MISTRYARSISEWRGAVSAFSFGSRAGSLRWLVGRYEALAAKYAADWPAWGHSEIATMMRADGHDVSTSTVQRALRRRGLLLPQAFRAGRPKSGPHFNVALAVAVLTSAYNSSVSEQPEGVDRPSSDGYEATPFTDIALATTIVTSSDGTSIGGESNAVVAACVQLNNVCPSVSTAGEI